MITIPVDMSPRWVTVTADASIAYVTVDETAPDGSTITGMHVIDLAARTVVATVPLGRSAGGASGVALAPDGRRVYVPHFDTERGAGVLSIVDTATVGVAGTVALSGLGGGPGGVVVTPDGRRVYVATDQEIDRSSGLVQVIDVSNGVVNDRIEVNPFPRGAAITSDGRRVYVLDSDGDPAVIDTATGERTFAFGISGGALAIAPDDRHAYVANDGTLMVNVVDLATDQVVAIIDLDGRPTDIAVTPDGRRVYVSQRTGRNLSVIDTATHTLVTAASGWPGSGDGLAIAPDGRHAYVTDRRSRALVVVPIP